MNLEEQERDWIDRLLAGIRHAFPVGPPPPQRAIVDPGEWEASVLHRAFGGKPWTEVTSADVDVADVDIVFLTRVGWRYYLPAMLSAWVRGDYGGVWPITLRGHLMPPPAAATTSFGKFEAAWADLTWEQCLAIADVLVYVMHREPDEYALLTELPWADWDEPGWGLLYWIGRLRNTADGTARTGPPPSS